MLISMNILIVLWCLLTTVKSFSVRSVVDHVPALSSLSSVSIFGSLNNDSTGPWRIHISSHDANVTLQVYYLWEYNGTIATSGETYCNYGNQWSQCGDARISLMASNEVVAQGFFKVGKTVYHIHKEGDKYFILDESKLRNTITNIGDDTLGLLPEGPLFKRELSDAPDSGQDSWPSFNDLKEAVSNQSACYSSRHLAPIGVAVDSNFLSSFDSVSAAQLHVIDTVNKASVIWENAFNISLRLSDMIISGPGTQYNWNIPCNTSDNNVDSLEVRLNALKDWRQVTRPNDGLALWSLFSDCPSSDVIGLAWQSTACESNGVNILHHSVLDYQILAHESGHVFGAVHDCVNTTCATKSMANNSNNSSGTVCCPFSSDTCDSNGKYIMSPGSEIFQQSFSECTRANVCEAIRGSYINSTCLIPDQNQSASLNNSNDCANVLDPTKYRKCMRDEQCKQMTNSESATSCGSVFDCTISCMNHKTKKCDFYDSPLVFETSWSSDPTTRNNSCVYSFVPSSHVSSTSLVPPWGWAIIAVGGFLIISGLCMILSSLVIWICRRRRRQGKNPNWKDAHNDGSKKRFSIRKSQIKVSPPMPQRKFFNRDPITGLPPILPYNMRSSSLEEVDLNDDDHHDEDHSLSSSSSIYSDKMEKH